MALRATLSRRHSSQRLFVFLVLARRDTEILFYGGIVFLEFGDQTFNREIQRMRVCPILLERLVDATRDVFVSDLDGCSRRLSKLPGARLIEPTRATSSSAMSGFALVRFLSGPRIGA